MMYTFRAHWSTEFSWVSTVGPGEAELACARFDGPRSEDTLLEDADECGLLEGIESLGEVYRCLSTSSGRLE